MFDRESLSFTSVPRVEAELTFKEQKEKATLRLEKYGTRALTGFQEEIRIAREKINSIPDSELKESQLRKLEALEDRFQIRVMEIVSKQSWETLGKIQQAKERFDSGQADFTEIHKKIDQISFKGVKRTKIALAEEVAKLTHELAVDVLQVRAQRKPSIKGSIQSTQYRLKGVKTAIKWFEIAVKKELSSEANPKWATIKKEIRFRNSKALSKITPASQMVTRALNMKGKIMLASGERAAATDVVNQWTSEYSVSNKSCFFGNRSAVLAMERKHVKLTPVEKSVAMGRAIREGDTRSRKAILQEAVSQKHARINQEKARKMLSVELDQQLNNPRSANKEIETINAYMEIIRDPARRPELQALMKAGDIQVTSNDQGIAYSFPKIVMQLDHTTVGLLTLLGPEKEMWKNEYEALKQFDGKTLPFYLQMGNAKVEINCKWNINMYDFGVAEISSGNIATDKLTKAGILGSAVSFFTNAKRDQDRLNRQAFAQTLKRFQTYQLKIGEQLAELKRLEPTPHVQEQQKRLREDLAKAQYLMRQIKSAGGVSNCNKLGNAYALPARLMLLEFIMGGASHYHCKSGKDRTGLLDIEIKYLAQQLEKRVKDPKHEIPLYQKDESREDRKLRNQIALQSGNLEITEANTGEIGIKTIRRQAGMRVFGKEFVEKLARQEKHVKG